MAGVYASAQIEDYRLGSIPPPFEAGDAIFSAVEVPAEYPGGGEAVKAWITANLRYPETARLNGVEGHVGVRFVVEKDGTISHIHLTKRVSKELNEEATRLIESLPEKWQPATIDGQIVRSYFNIPVVFRLK